MDIHFCLLGSISSVAHDHHVLIREHTFHIGLIVLLLEGQSPLIRQLLAIFVKLRLVVAVTLE